MKLIPEWYEHQYCLIAWPCNKDLYGKIINKARDEVANVINEIAKTEHVIVLSNKEDINEIQNKTDNKNIDIVECKLDDSWMRDIAPIFYNEDKKLKSISFEFNGYGKYPDYLNDNKISKFISNYLNIPTKISALVIEGGAITYDDKKNLFSTKNVIFNKNRKQKHSIEYIIKEWCSGIFSRFDFIIFISQCSNSVLGCTWNSCSNAFLDSDDVCFWYYSKYDFTICFNPVYWDCGG